MPPNQHSFAFLNTLLEHLDQVVFAYESDFNQFPYLNPAFESVFTLRREKLDAGALREMVHPEDHEYVTEAYQDLLAGKIRERMKFRVLIPGQGERWLRVRPSSDRRVLSVP